MDIVVTSSRCALLQIFIDKSPFTCLPDVLKSNRRKVSAIYMQSKRQTMYPPGYCQSTNNLMVTHALEKMYGLYKCIMCPSSSVHELPWGHWWIGNNRKSTKHIVCLFDCIYLYIYIIYIYIYIYIYYRYQTKRDREKIISF